MATKKRKGDRLPPFVALLWDVLNSPAYMSLKPSAAKLLPYFLGKPKRSPNAPECYQIEFKFSFPEALRLGFSRSTFKKSYDDLIDKGFAEKTKHGGLCGKGKGYNQFRLSKKWENFKKSKQEPNIKHIKKRSTQG